MLKSRILGGLTIAALTAAITATTAANGAETSSPVEQTATADLNKKNVSDNAGVEASEKAKQEAYEWQIKQQQAQYAEQKAAHERQVEEQKAAYERQVEEQKAAYQRQLEQYEQQVKNAGSNPGPAPSP